MQNFPEHLTRTSASTHHPTASTALAQQLQLGLLTALVLGSLVGSGVLLLQTVTVSAVAMMLH